MTAVDDRVQTLSVDTIRCLAMDAVQKANSGPSWHRHGARARRLRAVHRDDAARPGRARVARSRPLRALGRPRLHPAVRRAPPDGLRPHDGRPEAVPSVGVAARRAIPSCTTPPASTSRPARSDRASATRSAWRSPRRCWPRATTATGTRSSNHRTFAICSDGDLMEGVSGEASSIAGFLGLGKLCLIYDDNHITIEGSTDLAFAEDVPARYEAYGWHVQRFDDTLDDRHAARGARCRRRRDGPALVHLPAHAHRVRAPRTRRTPRRRTARRSARRRSA